MATIDSLALELLDSIFSHLTHNPLQSLHRSLERSSLVCRRWRDPAQRALFQTVDLNSLQQAATWLKSPARPRYRVQNLKMGWWKGGRGYPMRLLEACPDLLSLLEMEGGTDGGYKWCSSPLVEGLTSLSLYQIRNFPVSAGPLATHNLRHLNMYCIESDPALLETILLPSRHSLHSLCLEGVEPSSASTFVESLTKASFPLLRHLTLQGSESFNVWSQLIGDNFPSLVTIEFKDAPRQIATVVVAPLVNSPPALRNHVLSDWRINWDQDGMKELLRIVKVLKIEGLCRMEVNRLSKDDVVACDAGLALLDECKERSISLLCRYGYLTRDMMD